MKPLSNNFICTIVIYLKEVVKVKNFNLGMIDEGLLYPQLSDLLLAS